MCHVRSDDDAKLGEVKSKFRGLGQGRLKLDMRLGTGWRMCGATGGSWEGTSECLIVYCLSGPGQRLVRTWGKDARVSISVMQNVTRGREIKKKDNKICSMQSIDHGHGHSGGY